MINQFKIMNAQAFISIFGNIPNFKNSELLEVQLRRDGPTLIIRLSTKEAIKTKPKHWDNWDIVYIEMSFFAVKSLTINGLGTNNQIDQFQIKEIEENGLLEIKCSSEMYLKCSFDWARVEEISPGLIGSV